MGLFFIEKVNFSFFWLLSTCFGKICPWMLHLTIDLRPNKNKIFPTSFGSSYFQGNFHCCMSHTFYTFYTCQIHFIKLWCNLNSKATWLCVLSKNKMKRLCKGHLFLFAEFLVQSLWTQNFGFWIENFCIKR